METTIQFFEPMIKAKNSHDSDYEHWAQAISAFDSGSYHESIASLLRFLSPHAGTLDSANLPWAIDIRHGSVKATLEVTPDSFSIRAPFLKLPNGPSVPLLRKVTEINMSDLILAQVVLEDNVLYYQYSDNIELCEPGKIHDIIREVCFSADYHDDLFISKFKAEPVEKVNLTPIPSDKLKTCYQVYQNIFGEVEKYTEYFKEKRYYDFAADALYIGFIQVSLALEPQGLIGSELNKAISEMCRREDVHTRIQRAEKALKNFKSYTEEKLGESLYNTEFFLSLKRHIDIVGFQRMLGPYHKAATHERQNSDYMGSSMSLLAGIYNLFYRCESSEEITQALRTALSTAGGKTWKETSDQLYQVVSRFMSEQEVVNEQQKTA